MHLVSETPSRVLALVWLTLVTFLLVGCGSGDDNVFFSPTDDDPTLPREAVLVGGDSSLAQGGSTTYVVVLSRAARQDVVVTVETAGFEGLTVSPVMIPAGARSASFTVTAEEDAAEGARQLLLVAGDEYALGTPSDATVTVVSPALADQLPVATLVGGNTSLGQGGATSYAVTLDRPAPVDMTVDVLTTGFGGLSLSPVEIVAGQRSASFTVEADAGAPLGTRQLLLAAGEGYVLGTPSSATVTVVLAAEADGFPAATLVGGDASLVQGETKTYAVTLDRPAPVDITLQVLTAGLSGLNVSPVEIAAGERSAIFEVEVAPDAAEGARQLLLVAGDAYVLDAPSSVTVSVVAAGLPVATLVGGDTTLSQGGETTYVVTLDRPALAPTTVQVLTTGLAGLTVSAVEIPANQRSASFTVTADAAAVLGARQLLLVAGDGYALGTPSSATVTVVTAAQVTLVGGDLSLAPGASVSLGLVLDRPAPKDLTINLERFGAGAGFNVPEDVVVTENSGGAVVEVEALISAPIGSSVTVQVVPGEGYTLDTPSAVTITISDADLPQVSLFGGPALLAPGAMTTLAAVLEEPAPEGGLVLNFIGVGDSGAFEFNGDALPVTLTVDEGDFAATIDVEALPSAILGQAADLILVGGTNYRPATPSLVRLEVADQVLPLVSLVGADTQLEPLDVDGSVRGVTTFALFLNQPLVEDLDVNFVLVGDAQSFRIAGEEFPFSDPLTIPAGEQTFVFQVEAISGREQDEGRLTLVGGSRYAVDTAESSYLLDISNLRLPLAFLIPSELNVPVGETRQFTVQLEGDTRVFPGEDIDVNYVVILDADAVSLPTFGGVFTIPFGQASVTFDVTRDGTGDADVILVGGQGYRTTGSTMQIR